MITCTNTASLVAELKTRIDTRQARIGVIGLGYVGLPLALLYTEADFRVTGFDIDQHKVATLSSGGSYICRIPPTEIQAAGSQGFCATSDFSRLTEMDAIIICVPTPLDEYREPDLTFITNTSRAIAPHLRAGQLVILESTSYPGTTEEVLVPILEEDNGSDLKAAHEATANGEDEFFVAFSPEREDPGNDSIARRDIPKVVGGLNPQASELAATLYGTIFNRVVPVSSPAVAEMTKLLENIYRCVNIALVNELKLLSLRMGLDIWEVIEAASTKPFGFQPFYPGPGLGTASPSIRIICHGRRKAWDFQTRSNQLAGEINSAMPNHVVSSVSGALNQQGKALKGSKVLVLGVAYKKDIDDLRDSPARTIIEWPRKKDGAEVSYNDPYFPFIGKGRKYDLQMKCVSVNDVSKYDCALIVTDHSDYDYAWIAQHASLVVDTRNATRGIHSDHIVRC